MEILKNLSANELKTLKDTFSSNLKGALNEEDFVDAIFSACHKKPKFAELTKGQLSHLFASIDVTGRGYVSWEEFSMFAIEQAQYSMETVVGGGATNSGDGRQGDDMGAGDGRSLEGNVDTFITFRPYHVESAVQHSYGTVVNDLRSLPRARKLVQIIQDTKNNSQVTLINMDETQSVYAKLPKVNECITAWEYVPLTTGVTNSNSLFFSYNGGNVTTFPLEKKHTYDDMLSSSGSLLFSETQTALVWSSMYGRLLLGSRRGIVSVWDIDSKAVSSQEKVHQSPITALKVRSSVLFSSSLDRVNSVKGVDLEHSVVRFAFNDHMVGGATCLEIDEEFLFTAGFEGKVMQRNLQNPKGSPTILFDTNEPHQGRITTMERKADTPLLFSGDSKGVVKVWDLRVGACVQTIYPSANATMEAKRHINAKQDAGSHRNRGRGFDGELVDNTSGSGVEAAVDATCVNAICQVHNSDVVIVVNKIETVSLTSTETSFPELVDDVSVCRFMLMPDEERLVTVHDTSAKLWNLENGYLLYATDNNLLPSDVSACALLEPLNRQFLLASMTGELKAFSVALGKETIDFSPLLKEANAGGKEILSLNTIAQYRDYNIPYMIVTQADAVYILPVSKEAAVTNVIRLNAIQSVLNESKTTVVSTRLLHCRWLFVSFANATVSLFDITRMTCLLVTFQLPSGGDLEALHVSTFRPPKGETPSRLKKADESNHLLVFGGNSEGMLCIDEAIPNASQEIETDDGMNYTSATKEIFNIIGEWSATLKDSSTWRWIKGKRFLRQGAIPPPTQKDPSSPTRKLLRSKESPTRLNGLLSGVSTATHLYFSPEHLVLFVGTDRGDVKLWDVAGVIKAGGRRAERDRGRMEDASRTVRPTASYPPVLITEWHAHKSGFTAWMGFLHPVTQLPVLMTGGTDRRVFLWSADGVPLGSLSTGRQMDDRSGGKRFGLDPFLPPQEVREEAQWPIFAAYLQQRETKLKVEEPQVARVSAPKDNTVTLSKLDDTVGDAGQTTFFVTETPSRPAQPDQDLLALILSTSGSSSDDSQEDGRGPRLVKSQYSAKITQRKSFANLSRTGATVKEPLPSIENKRAGNFYGFDRKTGLLPNTARATEKKKESENNRSRSTTAARVGEKVKKGKSGKRRTSTSAPPSTSVPRQYQIESLLPRL